MPDLRPFRGLRYDPARVPDLSAVLCPPYDVIAPAEREALLARDPRNAVRLELPAATPASATEPDIEAAAAALDQWTIDGTLARDETPLIYVYEQRYADQGGASRIARSFLCEMRLEDYGPESGVRPHEHTLGPAKEHRFNLLSAVKTHLSPVLLIYDADSTNLLDEIVEAARPREAIGPGGVGQRLWGIDPDVVPAARDLLALAGARPVTIADGHHRYETALRYRDTPGSPPGSDHVLALFYSAANDGLALAPWHRVISGLDDLATTAALGRAREFFRTGDVSDSDELITAVDAGRQLGFLGVWTRNGGSVLEVDPQRTPSSVGTDSSENLRSLDVSVLSGTLSRMVGHTESELAAQGRLSYTHDANEAVAAVNEGRADVCFLLRPTPVEQVMAVAAAGEFMPAKSTYFYPKAATGLVFDPLS